MAKIIRETIITKPIEVGRAVRIPVKVEATETETIEYLIYFFFGVVETLLAFRLLLKLTGASTASGFVDFIYSLTGILILPFEGIFRKGFSEGLETTAVLEPSTMVAVIVYAVIAWGVISLIRIASGEQQSD